MIPKLCPTTAPPGEKQVFDAFANQSGDSSWTVLHSLWIAEHQRQVEGEADFLVLVPGRGFLFIEVKSHSKVEFTSDGFWRLGQDAPTQRSPFRQATEAMHSVRNYLRGQNVDIRDVPFLSCVWFTQVPARRLLPSTPEWHDWQVLDSDDLAANAESAVLRVLEAGTEHLRKKTAAFSSISPAPEEAIIRRVVKELRPQFDLQASGQEIRKRRNDELIQFLNEQYDALDAALDNAQVLFTGPAGCGKTLLALEAAERESLAGKKGAVFCFNRLLGAQLAEATRENSALKVSTFSKHLLDISGLSVRGTRESSFWEDELPETAVAALLNSNDRSVFDFIVLDEVQDLLKPSYLDALDLLLEGGLKSGRLLAFGDFEGQTIFGESDSRQLLHDRCGYLTTHRLATNCRNLPRIGNLVNHFNQGLSPYKRFRRPDDGVNPEPKIFRDAAHQVELLKESVQSLREEGFPLEDIVVLSPHAESSLAASTTDTWLKNVLTPVRDTTTRKGQLRFASIQAFKGLEASAVILTDLKRDEVINFDALLYVGLTRATDRLIYLANNDTLNGMLRRT